MNWDMVLADLEAKVEELEHRPDEAVWEDLDAIPFAPAEVEAEMTPAQRQRAVLLLERVATCKRRLGQGSAVDGPGGEADRGASTYAASEPGSR